MDRKAAWAIVAAFPLLACVFYLTTRNLVPFWGYFAALAFYWFCVLTPLIAWRGGFRRGQLRLRWPGKWLILANVLPIGVVASVATLTLLENPLPVWIIMIMVVCACLNGTLEEVFWRGTVLQDGAGVPDQAIQLALFTGWHLALLFAHGVVITGGPLALLGGAALAGMLWTWARIQTGSIGFGIGAHIGLNVFAFIELAANNQF